MWQAEPCIFPLKGKMYAFLYSAISQKLKTVLIINGNHHLATYLP
jgi:hypothetical protein